MSVCREIPGSGKAKTRPSRMRAASMKSPRYAQHARAALARVGLVLSEIYAKVVPGHIRVSNALRFLVSAR